MALRGFTTPCGPKNLSPTQVLTGFHHWTGTVPASSTALSYRNKFTSYLSGAHGERTYPFLTNALPDVQQWSSFDHWLGEINANSEWLFWASAEALGAQYDILGVTFFNNSGAGGQQLKLVSFNYDGSLTPVNYVDWGSPSSTIFGINARVRIAVRSIYNSGADTFDIEVWAKKAGGSWVKEIAVAGITKASGKDWSLSALQNWTISQFERTAGKGGATFKSYESSWVWFAEEGSGIYAKRAGPELPPLACDDTYAVVAHPMYGDTSDAARDDWTIADAKAEKYQDVDDSFVSSPGSYIHRNVDGDEQEMKIKEHVLVGGGTAEIVGVTFEGEPTDSSNWAGGTLVEELAIHGTQGAAWTPAIFDSMFAIVKLVGSGTNQFRLHSLYCVVFGKDITTPANNSGTRATQTPGGGLSAFQPYRWGYYDPPPPAAGARRRFAAVV